MVKDLEVFDSYSFRQILSGVSGSPVFGNVTQLYYFPLSHTDLLRVYTEC